MPCSFILFICFEDFQFGCFQIVSRDILQASNFQYSIWKSYIAAGEDCFYMTFCYLH
jgi:hypothetical protein